MSQDAWKYGAIVEEDPDDHRIKKLMEEVPNAAGVPTQGGEDPVFYRKGS